MVSGELTEEENVGPEEATNNRFRPTLGVRRKGVLTLHDLGKEIFESNEDQDMVMGDRRAICVSD